MIRAARISIVLSTLGVSSPTVAPLQPPAQIVLIRHAEKPDDPNDPHLSPAGVERAKQFVSFVTTNPAMTRFGTPVAIYATKTTKDDNGRRTQETVAPLAAAIKRSVLTPYHGKEYAELAKEVLGNPAYRGKTVVICWNHEEIPELAAALGVTPQPPKWKGTVFDEVYIISYRNGKAALTTTRYGG